jgi:AraC-like DNA-binding protein
MMAAATPPSMPKFARGYPRRMAYRELVRPGSHVACVWIRDPEPRARTQRVLPDACVDVVWTGERLVVAGPATGPVLANVPAGAAAMGVRFRVGAAGGALGLPAAELLDATVALDDLWGAEGAEIAERVGSAPTPAAQLQALAAAVGARPRAEPDPFVRAAATGAQRTALGIGERQLRRRFADAVGYGPKTLDRVLRFQRFLTLAAREALPDLARLALEAGYADQAHLTRECTRLAGLPPAALLASGAGPAGDTSVSFKTTARDGATMAA